MLLFIKLGTKGTKLPMHSYHIHVYGVFNIIKCVCSHGNVMFENIIYFISKALMAP